MVIFDETFGSAPVRLILPVTLEVIVSSPVTAAHSTESAPEAVLLMAVVIASRNVQRPSLAAASEVDLTMIFAPTSAREAAHVGEKTSAATAAATSTNAAVAARAAERFFMGLYLS